MKNIFDLEKCFQQYWAKLYSWLPEGIVQTDLKLLLDFGLLDLNLQESSNKRMFHVIEGNDKVTLVNQDFVVWIVPSIEEGHPITYTLIAINNSYDLHPEICYKTQGAYNTSHIVLSVLEKYLDEIQENEILITEIQAHF